MNKVEIYPVTLPNGKKQWCVKFRSPIMPCSGFYYYDTREEAEKWFIRNQSEITSKDHHDF